VENGARFPLAGPNEDVNTHGLSHRANRRTRVESLKRAVCVQGRMGKNFKNVAGREWPSMGESHGQWPGMEEQVGTSGEVSVQGLVWASGEPRSAVTLVRLPAIFQGADERFP
jgi:hypothetical protein